MNQFCYLATILALVYNGRARHENLGNSILICKLQTLEDSKELVYNNYEDNNPDSVFDSELNQISVKNDIPFQEYAIDYDTISKKKAERGRSTSLELSSDLSLLSSESRDTDSEEKKRRKRKKKQKKKKKEDRTRVIFWYTTKVQNLGFNVFPQYQDWATNNPLNTYQTDIYGRPIIYPTNVWSQNSVSYHRPYPTKWGETEGWGHKTVSYNNPRPTKGGKGTLDGWGHKSVSYHKPYPTTRGYGAVKPKKRWRVLRFLK
ncbi:hypothetical protein O0L34_g14726 [Tuta absoluta]|nr:hypothetical protein O0L34_g14726 [Tuta absoluta]